LVITSRPKARQAVADAVGLAGRLALDQAGRFKHGQDAEGGRRRQAGMFDDFGQGHRALGARHDFHDGDGAQGGGRRVAGFGHGAGFQGAGMASV
jgi:hypothetical protein